MAETSTTTPAEALARERDRLLATKLHVPRPRPGFLARPRLLERLTEGTAHELTLVCAPAGFGKTSLLGDWARRRRQPVAWLSLDAGDSDPARFWRYVAAALDELRPGSVSGSMPCSRAASRRWRRSGPDWASDLGWS
jgi:LuxR family transcriptional regulator, maltose regulon positive regulatory protein